MMIDNINLCPCCSTPMLHHFGSHREYWFCRHCWQEIPATTDMPEIEKYSITPKIINLSVRLSKKKHSLAPV